MAKSLYIGVDGKARKVKAMWIGVNGVARKVKAGFIGVANVARQFFSSEKNVVHNRITNNLTYGRVRLAAASTGNYALFAGGQGTSYSSGTIGKYGFYDQVDAYNTSLSRSSATVLSVPRYYLASASNNGQAFFASGVKAYGSGDKTTCTNAEAYDNSLTMKTLDSTNNDSQELASATVGNYVLFAGGYNDNGTRRNQVTAYSTSLTKFTPDTMQDAKSQNAGASVGNYAIISSDYYSNTYDFYNHSLTHTYRAISMSSTDTSATSLGSYAIFFNSSRSSEKQIRTFDSSLTSTTSLLELSEGRTKGSATTVNGLAFFFGGTSSSAYLSSSMVDCYDESLTKREVPSLTTPRLYTAATSVGNFALCAGGSSSGWGGSFEIQGSIETYEVI